MILRAFRSNLIPAAALWGFVLAIWWLYGHHAATKNALDALADLKSSLGLGFSMPAQAVAVGLLPFCFQKLQRGSHRQTQLRHVPYLMLFFAVMGAMTDIFYTAQAHWFGNSPDISTVARKTAVDMLLYSPFIADTLTAWGFGFKDNEFDFPATRAWMGKNWFVARVLPIYGAALLVWTPTVMVIYSLPLALQFPLQAIVSCFWGLMVGILTDK